MISGVISGRVHGSDEARRAARDLRKAANRELTAELRKGIRDATKVLRPALAESAKAGMPSGYGPVLSPAMRVRTVTSLAVARGVGVRVTIYATGKKELRDVTAINAGRLRHPVFGRRRSPWVVQRVRPGFVDRPIALLEKQVAREIDAAASRVADRVERGTI